MKFLIKFYALFFSASVAYAIDPEFKILQETEITLGERQKQKDVYVETLEEKSTEISVRLILLDDIFCNVNNYFENKIKISNLIEAIQSFKQYSDHLILVKESYVLFSRALLYLSENQEVASEKYPNFGLEDITRYKDLEKNYNSQMGGHSSSYEKWKDSITVMQEIEKFYKELDAKKSFVLDEKIILFEKFQDLQKNNGTQKGHEFANFSQELKEFTKSFNNFLSQVEFLKKNIKEKKVWNIEDEIGLFEDICQGILPWLKEAENFDLKRKSEEENKIVFENTHSGFVEKFEGMKKILTDLKESLKNILSKSLSPEGLTELEEICDAEKKQAKKIFLHPEGAEDGEINSLIENIRKNFEILWNELVDFEKIADKISIYIPKYRKWMSSFTKEINSFLQERNLPLLLMPDESGGERSKGFLETLLEKCEKLKKDLNDQIDCFRALLNLPEEGDEVSLYEEIEKNLDLMERNIRSASESIKELKDPFQKNKKKEFLRKFKNINEEYKEFRTDFDTLKYLIASKYKSQTSEKREEKFLDVERIATFGGGEAINDLNEIEIHKGEKQFLAQIKNIKDRIEEFKKISEHLAQTGKDDAFLDPESSFSKNFEKLKEEIKQLQKNTQESSEEKFLQDIQEFEQFLLQVQEFLEEKRKTISAGPIPLNSSPSEEGSKESRPKENEEISFNKPKEKLKRSSGEPRNDFSFEGDNSDILFFWLQDDLNKILQEFETFKMLKNENCLEVEDLWKDLIVKIKNFKDQLRNNVDITRSQQESLLAQLLTIQLDLENNNNSHSIGNKARKKPKGTKTREEKRSPSYGGFQNPNDFGNEEADFTLNLNKNDEGI